MSKIVNIKSRLLASAYDSNFEAAFAKSEALKKRGIDSAAMLPYWTKVDDIVKGQDAIKAKRDEYLVRFVDEDDANYNLRLRLARFTNVYRDIIEGLSSKPFEKPVSLGDNAPEAIKTFCEDVDGTGSDISTFAHGTFFNGINCAADWIFVDYPTTETQAARPRTVAEEKAAGYRPFWSHVLAENVLDVKWAVMNGKLTLVYIKILERGEPNRIREMHRDATGARYELFEEQRQQGGTLMYVSIAAGPITIGEIPMVLFSTGRRDGTRYYFYPPMKDAADLQIELYEQESGEKYIRTVAAYPMVAAEGVKPDMEADGKTAKKMVMGPMRTLYAKPDGEGRHGSFKFMTPDAAVLKYLADQCKETTQQLRELGRQPLTAQSSQLTVVTAATAAAKARSAVVAWALLLENALEEALILTAKWLSLAYNPDASLYTDFDDFMDGNEALTQLREMRKARDLSQRSYWKELKRRKLLPDDFDDEKEVQELLDETPGDEELDEFGNPIKDDVDKV